MGNKEIVVKGNWLGQETRNVLRYVTNAAADSNMQEIVDAIRDAFDTLAPLLTDECNIYGADVYDLDVPRPRVSVPFSFTSGPVVGSDVGISLPTQIAMVVRTLGSNPVKPNRGRLYLAGMSKDSLKGDTGLWQDAALTTASTGMEQLRSIAGSGGETAELQVMRLAADGTVSVSNPIASVQAVSVPGTQRKRRIGSGA